MLSHPTFKDLYDFVLKSKGAKTFINYSDERVLCMLKEGLDDNTLFYNVNTEGKITGMILAVKDVKHKILFVTENLAMSLTTLKEFARKAKQTFPEYQLQAIRHGGHRKFNTEKLYNKLTTK